jgi:hypothetical protein
MNKQYMPKLRLSPAEWAEEFAADASEYKKEWEKLFDEKLSQPRRSRWGMIKKASKNFARIPGDFLRLGKSNYKSQDISGVTVEMEIEDRLLVLRDASKNRINKKNRKAYRNLAANEVATEINCRNVVRIKGLTLGEFYKFLSDSGCNIRPFFSEDKGENAGRWVMDDRKLPVLLQDTLDPEKDKYYLERMFPHAPSWLPWSQWTNSRTHGVIYDISEDGEGKELVVPTHVDAENALVAIKEIVTGKKRRRIGAIEYHRMPEEQGEAYVGSGLGELGCLLLVGIFQKAAADKIIKAVNVVGLDKLSTSGSIAKDDEFMWELYRLVKGRALK